MDSLEEELREAYRDRPEVLVKMLNSLHTGKKRDKIYTFYIENRDRILALDPDWLNYFIFRPGSDNYLNQIEIEDPEFQDLSCQNEEDTLILYENFPPSIRGDVLSILTNNSWDSMIFWEMKAIAQRLPDFEFDENELKCFLEEDIKAAINSTVRITSNIKEYDVTGVKNFNEWIQAMTDSQAMSEKDYQIQRKIGEGGSRRVYLATDKWSGDQTCIKIFKTEGLAQQVEEVSNRKSLEERAAIEVRGLRRLSHPNVIRYFTSGKAGELVYIEEEYIDGTNLSELAFDLGYEEKCRIFLEIAKGLNYLHEQGFLARDLKLENVLVSYDKKTVKIDDLEFIATRINQQQSNLIIDQSLDKGTLIPKIIQRGRDYARAYSSSGNSFSNFTQYSRRYESPERKLGHPATIESDIFALGCLFFYLLTGERDTFEHLSNLSEEEYKKELKMRLSEIHIPSKNKHKRNNLNYVFEIMLDYNPKNRELFYEGIKFYGEKSFFDIK